MGSAPAIEMMVAVQEITLDVLGNHVHVHSILLWGAAATLLLTLVEAGAQERGISRISLPFLIGTAFTGDRRRALWLGFIAHFTVGWILALAYAMVMEDLGRTGWWLGAVVGLVHGATFLGLIAPLLPLVHPRMADELHGPTPTAWLQPPGWFAMHYGRWTPLVSLVGHGLYGAVLGGFYELAGPGHGPLH